MTRNRLTDVEYYDNNSVLKEHVHYVYDVFDHLIATEVDTTGDGTYNEIDHWVLDVSPEIPQAGVPGTALAQPVLGFGPTGSLTTRYFEVVDRIFAEEAVSSLTQGGTNTWDLVNNLASVVYVLDNTGAVTDNVVYNGFGVVAYESSAAVDHFAGFAGGHDDQNTGLVGDYHRWYDPATGRWISEDPRGFAAGDRNLARYAENDAMTWVDPIGLQAPQGSQINPRTGWPSVIPPGYLTPPAIVYVTGTTPTANGVIVHFSNGVNVFYPSPPLANAGQPHILPSPILPPNPVSPPTFRPFGPNWGGWQPGGSIWTPYPTAPTFFFWQFQYTH